MLKQLKVSELSPGMMVTQVLAQNGPVKIRKVGFIRSPDMIRGLTEMGVTLVEVDINQSLNVELDDETSAAAIAISEDNNKPRKATATQRLVASDQQIADVDRQLSQQFHRALFLPAVDQMPSKWMLYGKPYTMLSVFILAGLFLGAIASYSLIGLITNGELVPITQVNTSTPAPNNTPEQSVAKVIQTPAELNITAPATVSENAAAISDKIIVNDNLVTTQEQNVLVPSAPRVPQARVDEVVASNMPRQSNASSSPETVNGIALEEGQQVLGYQSGNDEQTQFNEDNITLANDTGSVNIPDDNESRQQSRDNRSTNNESTVSNSVSNERLNPTLLRRIQAAAEDVDSQVNDPKPDVIKITDLNQLPRIDQLSPAILTLMPAMSFSAHMYASNPRDRWVRVNSKRLGEGDVIANNVILKRIESEKVVLDYNGTEFTMNALSDW
jgi:general secretion pathway protein B